jgi:hypothetical protein
MYAREKVAFDYRNSENMTTYLLPPVFSHEDPLGWTSNPSVQTLFKIGFQFRLFFLQRIPEIKCTYLVKNVPRFEENKSQGRIKGQDQTNSLPRRHHIRGADVMGII